MNPLDPIRQVARSIFVRIARELNSLTGGRIHPNAITVTALLAHIPISWLIATRQYLLAAVLLVIFGLFDALDGALARVQQRVSKVGMLLDSITDRMKEIIIYIGIALALINGGQPNAVVWAVAACGASLLVSYVNAWGEAVVAGDNLNKHELNKSFRSGLMSFDIRITVILVGLASGKLVEAVIVIAVLAWITALERLIKLIRALQHVQS